MILVLVNKFKVILLHVIGQHQFKVNIEYYYQTQATRKLRYSRTSKRGHRDEEAESHSLKSVIAGLASNNA